jgi:hypothetical protein
MRVISSAELRGNMKKYLDLASSEQILIQRGRTETFVLQKQEYLEPDEDLAKAISLEEFKTGAKAHIKELYRQKK